MKAQELCCWKMVEVDVGFSGIKCSIDVDWWWVSTVVTRTKPKAHDAQAFWTVSYVAATCICIMHLTSSAVTSVVLPR